MLINDYFAKDRILFFSNHKNRDFFKNEIVKQRDWIIKNIENQEKLFFKNKIEKININSELSNKINKEFDITMIIQEDYQRIDAGEKTKDVWIGRAYPYRWIYLYEDDEINMRDEMLEAKGKFEDLNS